ncbi:hypothetical protein HY572_03265 [Candidatus Micrarchaeota archaeon]|nr:hypothetical protein [Candidatus Micrarchaeota archaeon]
MFLESQKSFIFVHRQKLPPEFEKKIKSVGGKVELNDFTLGFPREGVNPTGPTYLIYARPHGGIENALSDGRFALLKFALLNPHRHEEIREALNEGDISKLLGHVERGAVPIYPALSSGIVLIGLEAKMFKDHSELGTALKRLQEIFGFDVDAVTHVKEFPVRPGGIRVVRIAGEGEEREPNDPFEQMPAMDQHLIRISIPAKSHDEAIGLIRNATQGMLGRHFREDIVNLRTLPGFEKE